MTSILSAFPFIGEQSFATPGAFNSPLSIISANIAAINADVGAVSGVTISPPSGNTIQMPSDLSISGYLSVGKGISIGTTAPSIAEPVALTIGVNSGISDYLYFNDTSNLRSDYLVGSHAGGTADGLNIFDVSGNTMIVGFSKQSVRFYVPVVGNAFDQGGAVFNLLAYGAIPDDSTDASPALLALLAAMPASGGDILINGQFALASTVTVQQSIRFLGTGIGSKWRRGVNSDITGSGSQLRYSGSSGDMLAFRASTTTPQLHVAIENLTLVGNARVSGSTRGSVLRFFAPDQLIAINPRLIGVHVQESSGDGITFDGNVFEGGTFDCVVSQCSESGISAQANSGGAPGELAFIRTTLSLNSVGMNLGGGGDFSYTQLSSSNNQQAAIVATSVHLAGVGLNMESNGSVYFRGVSLQRSILGGVNVNYTGSTGSSNATGIFLDANCTGNTIIGFASNGTDASTDIVLAPGAQSTVIIGNYSSGFAQRINDQGYLTQIIHGSQFSKPVLALDGSTLTASLGFFSERSLGWYRSGASSMALTYGQVQVPTGTALAPGYAFSSESSLGFYRSAASTIVQSYGTFGFSTFSQIGSGVNRITHAGALRTGLIGSSVNFDLGTLILRDGNGDTATGGTIQVFGGTAAAPTYTYTSETTLGLYRSGVATIAQSQGTFNLATNAVRLSMRTIAASALTASAANTNVAVNEAVFTIQASGASFVINSGGTTWIFNSSASAKNT